MNKKLFALAAGTFALGMSEFVMMCILPQVSEALSVSIPQAGRLISAYAIGVCAGAFSLIFLSRFRPKQVLMSLAGLMVLGAAIAVSAQNYAMLLLARFVEGLPHGAYFGVGTIVAVKLADEGKQNVAVALVCAGMTVANLIGNPLATTLGEAFTWRVPFAMVLVMGLLAVGLLWCWIPDMDKLPSNGMKGQFRFLKSLDPWLILGATFLGKCGVMCWYSYISPLLQEHSGFSAGVMPLLMVIAGLGMFVGNLVGGRLSDRFKPGRVTFWLQCLAALGLAGVFMSSQTGWMSVALMFLVCACIFGLSAPEQFMIIDHSKGGEMVGGCCIQLAFNLGTALGALLGGIPIDRGLGYGHTALVGIPLVLVGAVMLWVFRIRYEE